MNRILLILHLAGMALLSGGCAIRPPENRLGAVAADTPTRWVASGAAQAGIDQHWIKRFGDDDLSDLVDEAMKNNPDLRISAERVRRAQASARLAATRRDPRVEGRVNGILQKQRFMGFPLSLGSYTSDSYGASVGINWELDVWGRVLASQRAAFGDYQVQQQEYRAARASLAAQVTRAWFALGEANDQIRLAEAAILVREKIVQSVRERFAQALVEEGGLASQLRLAETDLASSRASVARWRAERERALRQVELLAGRYPRGKALSQRGLPKAPASPPAGLPSSLLLRRPDILAAERRYAAAGERSKAAVLARYPSFSLTGSRGTSSDALSGVLDSSLGVWSLAGGVVQPLLAGRRLREEANVAAQDEKIALRELQRVVLRSFGEVEQALVAESYYAKRQSAVAESARLAKEAASAAIVDFSDGAVDALTLLSAQDRQVQTAFQLAELLRMRLENRVNLHLALGGDFEVRGK